MVLSAYEHCRTALAVTVPDTVPVAGGGCPHAAAGLRRRLRDALTPRTLAALVPYLRDRVDDRFDSVAARGRLDAVSDLAHPVPMAALTHLLGLPAADGPWLHRRALALAPGFPLPLPTPGPHPSSAAAGSYLPPAAALGVRRPLRRGALTPHQAARDLDAYLTTHLCPSGALFTGTGTQPPPPAEAAATARFLLTSAYLNTAALVAAGVLALLRAPHETQALRHDPSHAPYVVEETLRHDPPPQILTRRATTDLDLDGLRIPRGTLLLLLLAAAHRDPAAISSPDLFAADGISPHLAFGTASHTCPGASLARLIAETVLVRFAQRIHGPRLALGTPSYHPTPYLRALRALWVGMDGVASREVPWHQNTT
ncbi:cytochrome P450 [Streptomyces sp. NPDC057638]|uniref:cytochrome P450 n=1 Tax=Streptomyces sp. NPDC057638 TaxID=3346190 RepID=UPI0036A80BEE